MNELGLVRVTEDIDLLIDGSMQITSVAANHLLGLCHRRIGFNWQKTLRFCDRRLAKVR